MGEDDTGIVERVLRPLGDSLAARAPEVGPALVDRMRSLFPEALADPDFAAAIRASAQADVRAVGEAIAAVDAPTFLELPREIVAVARDGAQRGVPFAPFQRIYRVGQAELWKLIAAELAASVEDRDELVRALEICSERLFAYVDAVLLLTEDAYAAERDRFVRSAAAVRAETIAAILDGRLSDPVLAGRRLGHELNREHLAIVLWQDDPAAETDGLALLEAAITELARATAARMLVHPLGLHAAAAWLSSASPIDVAAVASVRLARDEFPNVRVATGEAARGLEGFRATHEQASNARRVATLARRPGGSVTRYASVALQALACSDPEQARQFVQRELGALAAADDTSLRLAATLRAYLDEHSSRSRAAARLGIHENTISYRIRQVEEILGRRIEGDTLNLHVALALAAVVRDRSGRP